MGENVKITGHRATTELVALLNVSCVRCHDSIGSHTAKTMDECQQQLANEIANALDAALAAREGNE